MHALITMAAVGVLALFAAAEQAAACSCASPERPPSLKNEDAAVTARLLEVERDAKGGPFADTLFTYKVRRVFKGRTEYGLHHGVRLEVRSTTGGAACGLPTRRDRVYALILYEWRRELHANLCTMVSRKYLRRAARNRESEGAGRIGACGRAQR